jgi:hydroxyacylglutathione hydrolase
VALHIEPVPCLNDNYAYLLWDPDGSSDGTWVVDPSEAGPVEAALVAHRRRVLTGILATHHHPDHVGGIPELVAARRDTAPWVAAHRHDADRIPHLSLSIDAPADRWIEAGPEIGGLALEARHIPGHTLGAIAWRLGDDRFTGDTLFAAGCGRLFEGTAAQMHASLRALCDGAPHTRLWFGHEYTAANLRFAREAEPDNAAVEARANELESRTTPSTIADEHETNPFLRAPDAERMAQLRTRKDSWRG